MVNTLERTAWPFGSAVPNTLACAQQYATAGLCVIPVRTDGSKAPALPKWKEYEERVPDPAELCRWFAGGAHGIALVNGAVSGGLETLDFDEAGLYERFEAVYQEQREDDLLERLPLVETPSGGRHLLYRCTGPVDGSRKLAQRLAHGKVETLIETRGEGGYIVAPGSPVSCHPAGTPYRFLRGGAASLPRITPVDRHLLLTLAVLFNEYVKPECVRDVPTSRLRHEGNTSRLMPGEDYNARGDYEAVLTTHGWRHLRDAGDKKLWQRPGKTGPGLSATSNYAGRGLFYVFSANAAPFEPQEAYSPFAVYTQLEHGGDFSKAAAELCRQGYGDPPILHSLPSRQGESPAEPLPLAAAPPPLVLREWPTLAPEAMSGLAGDFVRAIEPHTEADPVALLVQFLLAFGSSVGRGPHFQAEADSHGSNLFAVLVGVSSKGRKGTAWGHIRRVFAKVDSDWVDQRVLSGLSTGEGLIHAVRDSVEKEELNKKTQEMETIVLDAGVEDKRLLVMEGEFASVLRQTQRDGNTLSATVRNAWDTGILRTMTRNSPVQATGAHVSLIGHITQGELQKDLAETETANGFGNRFLWVCTRRSKELPEGGDIDQVNFAPLLSRLHEATELARTRGRLLRDAVARAVWRDIYHDLSSGKPGLLGAMTARAEAQTMRLALVYALLDGADEIRAEHLQAGLAVWEYCEASACFIFGDSLGDRVADDILRALRENKAGLTRTEISGLFGKHQSASRITQALTLLVEQGHVRVERRDTGGRPVERFFAAGGSQPGPEAKR